MVEAIGPPQRNGLGLTCSAHGVATSCFEEGPPLAKFELDRMPTRQAATRAATAAAVTTADRRKRATPFISKKVAARQEFRCAMCGDLLQEDWEIDHVLSLQHGGGNELSNLQALHKRCHAYKNHLEQRR